MSQFENELKRDLAALAEDADVRDYRAVHGRARAASRSAHRRRLFAAGSGIAAVACAVALLNMSGILGASTNPGGASSDTSTALRPPGKADAGLSLNLPQEPGEPCLFARRSTLAELAVAAEAPVWLPAVSKSAPSQNELTGAWLCGPDAPLLTFGDMQVNYEPGWSDVDVDEKWSDLIRDYGGYVETVQGHPALVQPLTKESTRPQVMMIHEGVLIRILGDATVPVEDLVELARSLNLDRPIS